MIHPHSTTASACKPVPLHDAAPGCHPCATCNALGASRLCLQRWQSRCRNGREPVRQSLQLHSFLPLSRPSLLSYDMPACYVGARASFDPDALHDLGCDLVHVRLESSEESTERNTRDVPAHPPGNANFDSHGCHALPQLKALRTTLRQGCAVRYLR